MEHVLVLPFPIQSHIGPMMELAQKLVALGSNYLVTFVNTEEMHARLLSSAGAAAGGGEHILNTNIRLCWLPYEFNASCIAKCAAMGKDPFLAEAEAFLKLESGVEELIKSEVDPPITCFIADFLAPFAPDVAKRTGVPCFPFLTMSAASHVGLLELVQGHLAGVRDGDSVTSIIPGAPSTLKKQDLNTFVLREPDDLYHFFTGLLSRRQDYDAIIINTYDALEPEAVDYLRRHYKLQVYSVGPLLPSFFAHSSAQNGKDPAEEGAAGRILHEEYSCVEWLDQQEAASVLYVSFGSLASLSPKQLEEIALGLEASGHTVLWVARRSNPGEVAANALPNDFVQRMDSRLHVTSWAPQLRVLCHPAVGAFLTHSGWNSTIESVAAGVPMLSCSTWGDQKMNSVYVQDGWEVGLRLEPDATDDVGASTVISRQQVREKICRLMQNKGFRQNAHDLSRKAKEAVRPGGGSHENLYQFLENLERRGISELCVTVMHANGVS